ncbi:MAG TPA: glutathione S-transferase N-terminal domain-containing protein [Aliidongia sp.]|uniref:glutathione S-transferase N-terminal domain-containing protein n=1 Tax=Aliidongia sp. TaxID=1914230 RepID=UPI002DDC99A6|nr:glutathione S-transferase N-terminal domain-containing protein [Aliidongia sp.]HEV2673062.1 glutathione S-transferase N-terminal domain-containing protein [Aliidongia sp.]
MIDLYFWPTPNGHKISLFLEEGNFPYTFVPIDIERGDQFDARFLAISPNNRIPAIVDHDPPGGGDPVSVFESGAILLYLAEKTGRFLPAVPARRLAALQWTFWQVGGLGPMAGQAHHFRHYAAEPIPYAIDRYTREVSRLYGVLDRQLAYREYVADEYSIADMASYPWVYRHAKQGQELERFPHLARWYAAIGQRPSTLRAYSKGEALTAP